MKGQLKSNSLLRMCPDCGAIISWNSYFSAFMHANQIDCAYMENLEGKRLFDNKMREENLRKFEEEIQTEY